MLCHMIQEMHCPRSDAGTRGGSSSQKLTQPLQKSLEGLTHQFMIRADKTLSLSEAQFISNANVHTGKGNHISIQP